MESTLHFQLLAAHALFKKRFMEKIRLRYPELLPGQPKVIDFLIYRDGVIQWEIAEACLLEPPTLSGILKKMENAGLVRREKLAGNNKENVITLTKKGREIGETAKAVFRETEDELCRGLTAHDRRVLVSSLQTITQNAMDTGK